LAFRLNGDPELKSQRRNGNNNNIFLHIHANKIHPFSLRWNYTFGLGIMCLGLFIILSLSGFLLMIYYKPDTARAYFSIKDLMYVIPSGRFVRNIHRWAGHLMVITCCLHMARVFYTSAYKRGRAFNWNIGLVLFLLTLGLSFTGYLLPWDQLAYWAGIIGVNIAASPAQLADALGMTAAGNIGSVAKHLLLGSDQIGNESLVRFYVLHCMLLPLLMMAFIGIHMWRIRKGGGLSRPDRIEPDGRHGLTANKTVTAVPHAFLGEFTAFMFILAITVVMAFFFDAPIKEPANPLVPENPAKAPWYFLGIQELVSYSAFTGGIGIPLFALLVLGLIPYFDRSNEGIGRWFGNKAGVRVTAHSTTYATICTISILALAIGFEWPGVWLRDSGQWVAYCINPGTILLLLLITWSLFVGRRNHSIRMGATALFTCLLIALVVLTYVAWGHRGPNWDFYWQPLSWPQH